MEDSTQELASCVCNYAQVRGCRAVCLGLGFEARKEGREKGEGRGGVQESERRKRSSEARENLVILRTAASLMDSVCAVCMSVFSGRGGSAGKGCVYPICSLPLPCGRKNHWPAPSQIPKDTEAGRETGTGEEEERERSRPQGVAKEPASGERMCVRMHVLTELKNLLQGLRN